VTISAGATEASLTVTPRDDALFENNETVIDDAGPSITGPSDA